MAPTQGAKPENMVPILIVLGVMFLGICIAMNLFSRARFKKKRNAFAAAAAAGSGRATPIQRRTPQLREPGTGKPLGPSPKCSSPASLRHYSTISIPPLNASSSRASSLRPDSSLSPNHQYL